jgi:hypothetical protein
MKTKLPFDPDIEIAHRRRLAEFGPCTVGILYAEHGERRHRHGDRDQQTTRRAQLLDRPEIVTGGGEQAGIDQGSGGQRRSAHLRKRQRREQPHR